MNPYFFPIQTALITFPIAAFVATLPYMVYNYRKYGAVSVWRTIVLFSFAFYLLCAYYLVILPLPDPAVVASYTTQKYDLVPFQFLIKILESNPQLTSIGGVTAFLKSHEFLEPFFNLLLLMPFGVYLAYYFKKNWAKCLLFSFFLSLFFELTQLSGLYGLYPRPYRLFSIDDLMLNSLGGMLGYFVFCMFFRFLPDKARIDDKAMQRSATAGYFRRIIAMLVDSMVITILLFASGIFFKLESGSFTESIYFTPLVTCIYSIFFCLIAKGRTPGKALVRLKLEKTAGSSFALLISLRWVLREGVFLLLAVLNLYISKDADNDMQIVWLGLLLLVIVLSAADMIYAIRKGKRLWYERLSRTRNVSTFKRKQRV